MSAVVAVSQVDRIGGVLIAGVAGVWLLVDGIRSARRERAGRASEVRS